MSMRQSDGRRILIANERRDLAREHAVAFPASHGWGADGVRALHRGVEIDPSKVTSAARLSTHAGW